MPSLLELPQELLDLIKAEALRYDRPLRRPLNPNRGQDLRTFGQPLTPANGLLLSNRRLHEGSVPLFYALNTLAVSRDQAPDLLDGPASAAFRREQPRRILLVPQLQKARPPRVGGIILSDWLALEPLLQWAVAAGHRLERLGWRSDSDLPRYIADDAQLGDGPDRPPRHPRWRAYRARDTFPTCLRSDERSLLPRACRRFACEAWMLDKSDRNRDGRPQLWRKAGPPLAPDVPMDAHPYLAKAKLPEAQAHYPALTQLQCWTRWFDDVPGRQSLLVRWELTFGEA